MKTSSELNKEYQEFTVKISKVGKDFTDAVNGLSPENLARFKREMREILPSALLGLINALKD